MLAKNSKRAVESILVADGNAALATGGQPVIDSAGYNLSSEQLAVYSKVTTGSIDALEILTAGDTYADAPVVVIAQGTPFSATLGSQAVLGVPDVNVVESAPIDGKAIISVNKKAYVAPRDNAWVVGSTTAANAIVPLDNTVFGVSIAMTSARDDVSFSTAIRQAKNVSFLTPDYTTLGTVSPLDHLVKNMVNQINVLSQGVTTNGNKGKFPFIALAVDPDGSGTGVATLTQLSTAGVNLGSTYGNYVTDAPFAAAITQLVSNATGGLAGTSDVVAINLATAGAAVHAEMIIIVSLPSPVAVDDRVWQVMERIQVGLPYGFTVPTTGNEESVSVREGEGVGTYWYKTFQNTAAQRQTQNRSLWVFLTPYNPVDTAATYIAYQIEHYEITHNGIATNIEAPLKTIVLIESGDTTTQTSFEAVMNPWLVSCPTPFTF
jgi:hypothetical protein